MILEFIKAALGIHQPAMVSDTNPLPVQPYNAAGLDAGGVTLVDASIASATGASQSIVAASATRVALNVSNPSATVSWWINETGGVAAANAAGCFELAPGARWTPSPVPRNAVTGIATATTKLTVTAA